MIKLTLSVLCVCVFNFVRFCLSLSPLTGTTWKLPMTGLVNLSLGRSGLWLDMLCVCVVCVCVCVYVWGVCVCVLGA